MKPNVTIEPISVEDFVSTDYREYSLYALYCRAIPGIDGLKPSQRKIVWTANKTAKELKKTAALAGDVISHANYHHGNSSLEDAIVVMTRKDNNLPILDGNGYFGSRVVPKASAARYTKSKIGANFAKYFPDLEICPQNKDPESPEPGHFLPLIPWLLVNGIQGVTVGFACTIQPRNPELLRKLAMAHLMGRDISKIPTPPSFTGFKGNVIQNDEGNWIAQGVINHVKSNMYQVEELTPGPLRKDRMRFVKILNDLRRIDAIMDYKDRCNKKGFNFVLKLKSKVPNDAALTSKLRNETRIEWNKAKKKFTPTQLEKEVVKRVRKRKEILTAFACGGKTPEEVIASMKPHLGLYENLHDNLTIIDENGNLKIFETVHDLIRYYTDYRLSMYKKRFEYRIERDTEKLRVAKAKFGFIRAVLADKIVLRGKKRADSLAMLMKLGIDEDTANILLRMPVHSFCDDELMKLKADCDKLTADIQTWKSTNCKEAYFNDLKALS